MANKKKWRAVYERDDPNFSNIMGGPHYNITTADEEVVATVWIDDEAVKCEKDALLLAAAPNLLLAAKKVLEWVEGQDEDYVPQWAKRLAKAVKKATGGDKNTQVFYD
jgi:hypothetical protein